jgi:hypothetical protein
MSTMNTDGKIIGNLVYHAAVITALEIGYAQITNKIMKQAVPKLQLDGYNMAMLMLDTGLAIATRDMLVKQGIIPDNILK